MKASPASKPGETIAGRAEPEAADCQPARTSLVLLHKILVPIDFSDCSKEALRSAVPFARQFGATLMVLHVLQPNYPADPSLINQYQEMESSLAESSKNWLARWVHEVVPPEISCQEIVRTGRPATEIVHAAGELSIDLIIISTHGYSGIKHVVFGSTAENVVRHSPCPVLTIRAKKTH